MVFSLFPYQGRPGRASGGGITMRLISAHDGKLLTLNDARSAGAPANDRSFSSGLCALDSIAPGGALARGAIHELLTAPEEGKAMFLAMMLVREMQNPEHRMQNENLPSKASSFTQHSAFNSPRCIIWCDPARTLYPPALAAHGFPLDRLILLYPKLPDPSGKELIWAMAECLRCKGVAAAPSPYRPG
jgi:hypothetical protein